MDDMFWTVQRDLAVTPESHADTDSPDVRRASSREEHEVIGGVNQVIVEVEDQDRAVRFWTETMGFELAKDAPYARGRWIEVRTPDAVTTLVLGLRNGEPPTAPDELPTSNRFFCCDDLQQTYEELQARGVHFPQPPVEQPWGWWSMFEDDEGNRFALGPRER
jgi:predicted enzyme related to lactoylglutathione lyase